MVFGTTMTSKRGRASAYQANLVYPNKIQRIVDAKTFLKIIKQYPNEVINSKYIPPKLGSKSLGKFYVEIPLRIAT